MIPKTPEATSGPDQVKEKRDEIAVQQQDLDRYKRMFEVAERHARDDEAKELADKINTQEKYLKELTYELELLEASLDEECEDEPEGEEEDDSTGSEAAGSTDPGESGEDGGEASL
jgi:hypothetical protein